MIRGLGFSNKSLMGPAHKIHIINGSRYDVTPFNHINQMNSQILSDNETYTYTFHLTNFERN